MNATRSTGNRGTILIVDDDPAVLVLIQTILTAADYRVLLAAERADAVRMATQKHLHIYLALLDVRMPGMSATALADEMLSLRPNVRVLFMSGFVDEEIIRIKMLDQYAGFLPSRSGATVCCGPCGTPWKRRRLPVGTPQRPRGWRQHRARRSISPSVPALQAATRGSSALSVLLLRIIYEFVFLPRIKLFPTWIFRIF